MNNTKKLCSKSRNILGLHLSSFWAKNVTRSSRAQLPAESCTLSEILVVALLLIKRSEPQKGIEIFTY